MNDPDAEANGPNEANKVEEAVRFFAQDTIESEEIISKSNWRDPLSVLEDFLTFNLATEDAKHGLSSAQVSQICEALITWTDRNLRVRLKEGSKRHDKKPLTAFSLPKQASSRLLGCLIPSNHLPSSLVRRLSVIILSNIADLDTTAYVLPILKWINCLLHYSVCNSEEMESIYEVFFINCFHTKLAPLLCDILYKLTNSKSEFVTLWRIKMLLKFRDKHRTLQPVENLLRKFKELKPDLVKQKLSRQRWVDSASGQGRLVKIFSILWSYRDQFDPNTPDHENGMSASLKHWGSSSTWILASNQGKKRKRACDIPPVEMPVVKKRPNMNTTLVPLNKCKTVGEMFDRHQNLEMPRQILSLLGNPRTFAILFLNPNSRQLQDRFSSTLYRTLYYEFFSMSCSSGYTPRKLDLLCRIIAFQEKIQESIPVVERFLFQYLQNWNGQDFFLEILRLITFIRISDFDEINECILNKIQQFFNNDFNCPQQLLVLTNLNNLCIHWVQLEYHRVKGQLTYSFFSAKPSNVCKNPLDSIYNLVKTLEQFSELGLMKLIYFSKSSLTQVQKQKYLYIYLSEVISIFMLLSRTLIANELPIRPQLPPSIVYFSMFSFSSYYLSRSLECLAMAKHELIPLCVRLAKKFKEEKNILEEQVALSQVSNLETLNGLTKDVLGVLSCTQVYLDRGISMFRRHWELEDEEIRHHLNVSTHPALFSLMLNFLDLEVKNSTRKNRKMIFVQMCNENSILHQKYIDFLKKHLPYFGDSLETFQWRNQKNLAVKNGTLSKDDSSSVATSGVSSQWPSRPRLNRSSKKLS